MHVWVFYAGYCVLKCRESCRSINGNFQSVCKSSNIVYVVCRNGNPTVKERGANEVFVASSGECGESTTLHMY